MRSIGTAAALLLALVFATAAVAKLRAPALAAYAFARLEVPSPRLLARLVPIAEALLAVLLVWQPRAGAVAALLALTLFSILIERARSGGLRTGCACFGGARSDAPLSGALLRNGMLGLAAIAALAGERAWIDVPAVVAVGTAALLGIVVLALWDLRSRTGRLWDNRLAEAAPEEMRGR